MQALIHGLGRADRSSANDHPWNRRRVRIYRRQRRTRLAAPTMTSLLELIVLSGLPFLFGIVIGYSLRSYVSLARHSRHWTR
jgi:hypothetical protein